MTREQLAAWQARLYEELLLGAPRAEGLPPPVEELLREAEPEAVRTARELAERWCRPEGEPSGGSPSKGA